MRRTPIGQRRHPITIEYPIEDPGDPGNPQYKFFCSEDAKIEPLSAAEPFAYGAEITPIRRHAINIRFRQGITPGMRIVFEGRKLNIVSAIDREERHIEMDILATERL